MAGTSIAGSGGGGVLVEAPACRAPRFGLFAAADVRRQDGDRWQAGVSVDLYTCDDIQVIQTCNTVPDHKDATSGIHTEIADPFTLVSGYKCSPIGRSWERAWTIAGDKLARAAERSVERAFWTGVDSNGDPIAGMNMASVLVDDITPGTGAVSIVDGIAMLESAGGDKISCSPLIHVTRGVATYAAHLGLLAPDEVLENGDKTMMLAGTGTGLVVGGGYTAAGPNNINVDGPIDFDVAAGEAWMFMTGSISIDHGDVWYTPEEGNKQAAIDRTLNDVIVFAEQTYAITFDDCYVAGIKVKLQSCCAS